MLDTQIANFTLPTTSGQTFDLASQRGKHVVIYFYPKDSTPGCTTEGRDFSALFLSSLRQVPSFSASRATACGRMKISNASRNFRLNSARMPMRKSVSSSE